MTMELYLRPGNDSPDHEVDDIETPLLIPLRLPVALLSNLSSDSQIHISLPNSSDGGDGGSGKPRKTKATTATDGDFDNMTLTITHHPQSGKYKGNMEEVYSMNVVDNHETTDWYRKLDHHVPETTSLPSSSSPKNNEMQYIGKTKGKCCYTLQKSSTVAATSNKLKEIGERTRRLLEDERKKRKEIVRLDDLEQSTLALPETQAPPPLNNVPPSYLTTKARMINTKKRKRPQRIVASNIDGWMPNVDDLLKFPTNSSSLSETRDVDHHQQQQQSSIVRLHGLPMGVMPEQIRKFFHGLNPDLIFALPTFSHPIQGWDATATLPSDKTMGCKNVDEDNNPQCIAKRHSSTFRVFVKFASSPVANAAIERTGEPIELEKEGYEDKGGESSNGKVSSGTKIVGASISISPVSKQDASFLLKHMVSLCIL